MTALMESHCIPFLEIPGTTKLFADYLYNPSRLRPLYSFNPFDTDSFHRAAEIIPRDNTLRACVAEVLHEQNHVYGGGHATEEQIARLRHGGAVAVVTGQQVGLFSGPAYSIYKALTTIRLAQELSEAGLPAVPVFWLACEDHDLAEVNHCFILNRQHRLVRIQHPDTPAAKMRVGEILLGENVTRLRDELSQLWAASPDSEALNALVAAYQPQFTYAEAFAQLLHKLFPGAGVVVLNPLDARLSCLAANLFRRALEESEVLQERLRTRQRELEHAGYHAQVRLHENSTLLFLNIGPERQPVRRRGEAFFVPGRGTLSKEELLQELDAHPENFTPNVLLRPLMQDMLLPTVAYVAGPAEVAYFAQASTLYKVLLGRMPVIVPRASVTLVARKLQRLLAKYQLDLCAVFQAANDLFNRMAYQRLPRRLQSRLEQTEKRLEKMLAGSATALNALDPTLAGAVETSQRKMLYQFHKIRTKAARAYAQRSELLARHLAMLSDSLYPRRALQERTVNFFSFLVGYGVDLVSRLAEHIIFPRREHQVLFLDR